MGGEVREWEGKFESGTAPILARVSYGGGLSLGSLAIPPPRIFES